MEKDQNTDIENQDTPDKDNISEDQPNEVEDNILEKTKEKNYKIINRHK